MDIKELREKIDEADERLLGALQDRMSIAAEIGHYKKKNGMAVYDPEREKEKLAQIAAASREDLKEYNLLLYTRLFELSRDYQNRLTDTFDVV